MLINNYHIYKRFDGYVLEVNRYDDLDLVEEYEQSFETIDAVLKFIKELETE